MQISKMTIGTLCNTIENGYKYIHSIPNTNSFIFRKFDENTNEFAYTCLKCNNETDFRFYDLLVIWPGHNSGNPVKTNFKFL